MACARKDGHRRLFLSHVDWDKAALARSEGGRIRAGAIKLTNMVDPSDDFGTPGWNGRTFGR